MENQKQTERHQRARRKNERDMWRHLAAKFFVNLRRLRAEALVKLRIYLAPVFNRTLSNTLRARAPVTSAL